MSERVDPQAAHDEAIAWVVRLDRAGDDPVVNAELRDWLAGDERRRGALLRAEAAWTMLDRAGALRGGNRLEADRRSDPDRWLSRRRFIPAAGAAAAGMAAVLLGFDRWTSRPDTIETAIGEIRRTPLNDGSLIAVNTQTKLEVAMERRARMVDLDEGEAWFQVAKDQTRPFVVRAGNVQVRAVGTSFSVRRNAHGTDVQVTEGIVEVSRVGDGTLRRRLAAGMKASIADATGAAAVTAPAEAEIDRALAWRTGQIILDGDTLGAAAAEFNRYNSVKIDVPDPELAREEMVGRFRTNEPEAFAKAAGTILNAKVEVRGGDLLISRR